MSESIQEILQKVESNNDEIASSSEIFNWDNPLVEENLNTDKIVERVKYLLPIDIEREIRALPEYVWSNEEVVKQALKENIEILAYLPVEIEKTLPNIFRDIKFLSDLQRGFRHLAQRVEPLSTILEKRMKNIQIFMEIHILNDEKILVGSLKQRNFSIMQYAIKYDLLTPDVQSAFWSAIERRPLNRLSQTYEWVGELPVSFFKNHEVAAYSFLFSRETLLTYPHFYNLLPARLSEQLTIIEQTDRELLIEIYHKSEFKNHSDFIEAILDRNPKIYEYLPDNIRHTPQIIFKHLSNYPQNVPFIMKELLAEEECEKIFLHFRSHENINKLIGLYPEILKSAASPEFWHTKAIMLDNAVYHEYFRNQHDWLELSSDKDNCLNMLKNSSLLYQDFSSLMQIQPEIGLSYLIVRNSERKHMGEENAILLSPELMKSPGFAIEAILINPETIKLLDEKWWSNRKFVIQFFKRLDEYNADMKNDDISHILVWLPSHITTFFESLGADALSDTRFTDVLERTLLVQEFEDLNDKPDNIRKKVKM